MLGIIFNRSQKQTDRLREMVESTISSTVSKELNGIRIKLSKYAEIADLQRELETMKIEKMRNEEEFAVREREVTHKVGLEKNRQEQELQLTRREALVEVRETNLEAMEERFKEHSKFIEDQLVGQIDRAESLVEKMLERLPSAEIIARIGAGNGSSD